MKKNSMAKIMAFMALFWITIWIVGTWLLVIFSWSNGTVNTQEKQLTQDELQKIINSNQSNDTLNWSWDTNTWSESTLTWSKQIK